MTSPQGPDRRQLLLAVGALCAGVVAPSFAQTAAFPNRPIRMLVPHAPGAITDTLARMVAEPVSRALGQPFVIENRPGANTGIATEAVVRAPADGYTLLMATTAGMAANPAGILRSVAYSVPRDFTPVSHVGSVIYVILANPSVPARNLDELVKYARTRPGLKYASGNLGGIVYMGMLTRSEKLDMLHVPYKSTPPAITDLLAGHVDVMLSDLSSALPLIKAGKLTALAVTGARRSPVAPDVPTLKESGIAGVREAPAWLAIYGPAGMPSEATSVLNREIVAALRRPELQERAAAQGIDLQGSTPDELARYTRDQLQLWKDLVRDYQIAPQD